MRLIPFREARAVAAELAARLTFVVAGRRRRLPAVAVGSVRRGAPASKDIDILVIAPEARPGLLASAALAPARRGLGAALAGPVRAAGDRRRAQAVAYAYGGRPRRAAVDLFLATPAERPFALVHFTGGRDFNVRVRAHARRAGLTLNQYGLFAAATGRRARGSRAVRTERDLLRLLGVTYRPPGERQK